MCFCLLAASVFLLASGDCFITKSFCISELKFMYTILIYRKWDLCLQREQAKKPTALLLRVHLKLLNLWKRFYLHLTNIYIKLCRLNSLNEAYLKTWILSVNPPFVATRFSNPLPRIIELLFDRLKFAEAN